MPVIILAGGQGMRLWPLSTPEHPKQFIEAIYGRSLLSMTIERALLIAQPEEIFVVTAERYVELVREQVPPGVEVITEPEGKNTAPAIALGLNAARKKGLGGERSVFTVLSSDHLIRPSERFAAACLEAKRLAQKGKLVAFGAPALRPETGYGYLKKEEGRWVFVEKPDKKRAEDFVASGAYLWNCGMFTFELGPLVLECEKYLPALAEVIYADDAHAAFAAAPSVSFDYAIMERSEHVDALALDGIDWSDVGAFDEVFRTMQKDASGNVLVGSVDVEGASDSLVIGGDKPIALVGAKNLCVVDTPSALLVADLGRAQAVKAVAERAKDSRSPHMERIALEPGEERAIHTKNGMHWIIVEGLAEVEGEKFSPGQAIFVPAGRTSAISNQSGQLLEMLEVHLADAKYAAHMPD